LKPAPGRLGKPTPSNPPNFFFRTRLSTLLSTGLSTSARNDEPMPTGANVEKMLLTPADAAVALSVSRTTVYELMNRGQLRSIKLGTCRRIPVEAVRELVERLSEEEPVTSPDYLSLQRRRETHG